MNTAEKTLKSSSVPERRLPYTPGARIDSSRRLKRRKQMRNISWMEIPQEITDTILHTLVQNRQPMSIILLSMTCRSIRQEIQNNMKIWYSLYIHWRGHITPPNSSRLSKLVKLNPSVPRSLPNFQPKPPPLG